MYVCRYVPTRNPRSKIAKVNPEKAFDCCNVCTAAGPARGAFAVWSSVWLGVYGGGSATDARCDWGFCFLHHFFFRESKGGCPTFLYFSPWVELTLALPLSPSPYEIPVCITANGAPLTQKSSSTAVRVLSNMMRLFMVRSMTWLTGVIYSPSRTSKLILDEFQVC